MPDLDVLIAARNEEYLLNTIEDVFRHARGDTHVIAVCDGDWPVAPIPNHPRLRLILPTVGGGYLEHSAKSPASSAAVKAAKPAVIGQRAGVNLAATLSSARYVMKLDAHCSLDDGFDVKLMAPYEAGELGPDATTIPAMINLHVFNWRCKACGRETYQGPEPIRCEANQAKDRELAQMPAPCGSSAGFEKVLVWEPRQRRAKGNGHAGRGGYARTEFWRFDHTLHFQYRGPIVRGQEDTELADVMSSVGACFFMRRDRFLELGGLDEDHGSWGQFGTEVACKSWLSGGRQVVNRRTFFAHAFRTQGGGWGFPYAISPAEQDYARRYSQNLWRGNLWPQQVRPLSWLIDYFALIHGWHQPDGDETPERRAEREAALAHVRAQGRRFESNHRGSGPLVVSDISTGKAAAPPAALGESDRRAAPSAGILYYSDVRGDARLLQAVRDQIQRSVPAAWPMVSVTLQPVAFGKNIVPYECIVCGSYRWLPEAPSGICPSCGATQGLGGDIYDPLERGPLTMFRQILAGLEVLDTDLVFFAEHDVLYHPSHFQFIPPPRDVFYYNQHRYQVSVVDGRAVHYRACQTANLCGDRQLLIAHYRKRIAAVEAAGGYQRNMGYEPGTNRWAQSLDGVEHRTWMAPFPNLDIRTQYNLSKTRWSVAAFRDKRTCEGWVEVAEIPGWGVTLGRFGHFLADLGRSVQTEGGA